MRVTRKSRMRVREHEHMFREYLLHLRLEEDDVSCLRFDAMTKIEEAFGIAEGQTNRIIVPSVVEVSLSSLSGPVLLPVTPVSSILEVRYLDGGGNTAVLSPDKYTLVADQWKTELHPLEPVAVNALPYPERVWITLSAGYRITDPIITPDEWDREDEIPGNIKAAVKLIAGNLFNSDSDQTPGRWSTRVEMNHERLLRPFRIPPYNKAAYDV